MAVVGDNFEGGVDRAEHQIYSYADARQYSDRKLKGSLNGIGR